MKDYSKHKQRVFNLFSKYISAYKFIPSNKCVIVCKLCGHKDTTNLCYGNYLASAFERMRMHLEKEHNIYIPVFLPSWIEEWFNKNFNYYDELKRTIVEKPEKMQRYRQIISIPFFDKREKRFREIKIIYDKVLDRYYIELDGKILSWTLSYSYAKTLANALINQKTKGTF